MVNWKAVSKISSDLIPAQFLTASSCNDAVIVMSLALLLLLLLAFSLLAISIWLKETLCFFQSSTQLSAQIFQLEIFLCSASESDALCFPVNSRFLEQGSVHLLFKGGNEGLLKKTSIVFLKIGS